MPVAYLLCGPSLAGKSTLAKDIAEATGAVVLCADAINAERGLPFGGEGLPESVWAETLRILLDRLQEHGARGRAVVVDDTLCYRWLRDRYRARCIASGLEPRLLLLSPSREVLYDRHAQASRSGSRPVLSLERLVDHLDRFEWPSEDEHPFHLSAAKSLGDYVELSRTT